MRKIQRRMFLTSAVDRSDDGTRLVVKLGRYEDKGRRPVGVPLSVWIRENS